MAIDMDAVTEVLREAAETAVLPRFRSLSAGEVTEKSPGEIVTVADREAEELITPRLRAIADAPVVGEEAASSDPSLIEALRTEPLVWLVDPLDGTRNFVRGSTDFAVMAALVRQGSTVAAWIVRPTEGRAYVAERGSGAWRDGERLHRAPAPVEPSRMRGAVLSRFLGPAARARVSAAEPKFAELGSGAHCAGVDYPLLAEGALDFVLFHRTLPWDHAPGTLLLTEAGGVAQRPDGSEYRPDDDRVGLLDAADPEAWESARSLLM
ncbi:fructose-1,6-bisphosphatase/inositol monophosphatase family enzyme [Nocardiopsis sp. Huas11]|uniref:inositol monophosphatase family protein n=1 Tax=Nocardiopsis sp. Huas11 TaxID=2183912 RepID=UPI000EAF339C|nr:inositol monophosphatase family protein [Nocardiopsis sp. Huas11]RKS07775.1 fructose-1,6-bisphosphatase/inositol monophosphatase family enzyme [Nocardiopsis sp. Huas11]